MRVAAELAGIPTSTFHRNYPYWEGYIIEGDVMDRKLIEQWQKDRDEVIELLDVDRFKAFYRLYQDNVYGGRPMPKSDKVIMASMCKVALEITTISEATKKKADEWLEANNFTKGIWR